MAVFIWKAGSGNLQDPNHWIQPPPILPPPGPFPPPPPIPSLLVPGANDEADFIAGPGVQTLTGSILVNRVHIFGPAFDTQYALSGSIGAISSFEIDSALLTLNSGGAIFVGGSNLSIGSGGEFIQNGGTTDIQSGLVLGFGPGSGGSYRLNNGDLSAEVGMIGGFGSGDLIAVSGTAFLGNLRVGAFSGADGFIKVSGNADFVSQFETVGDSGRGDFLQDGGSHTIVYGLSIANEVGSRGSYDLSAGDLSIGLDNLALGVSGTGKFSQSGGSNVVGSGLLIGVLNSGDGDYTLSGGSLATNFTVVGGAGLGTFDQTGGINSITSSLVVGNHVSGVGDYDLSLGRLAVGGDEVIGGFGAGSFEQSGGLHTIGGVLTVGAELFSLGEFSLSRGRLLVGDEVVGGLGKGVFVQSGGLNSVAGFFTLGGGFDGNGKYTLQAGTLSAFTETIGNSGLGQFKQTGGANAVTGNLVVGAQATGEGTYELSALSSLSVAGNEFVGSSGDGSFLQHGGSHQISGFLSIGSQSNGDGLFTLQGGTLSAAAETVGFSGLGTFTHTGGTNAIAGNLIVGSQGDGDGDYALSSAGVLSIGGNEVIGNLGEGSFEQHDGLHNIGGALTIGNQFAGDGSFDLQGGALTALLENIGFAGVGTFVQTGGVHSIATNLVVGNQFTGDGLFELSGGSTIVSGDEVVGFSGRGTVEQFGGTNFVSGTLVIGRNAGSDGSVTVQRGNLDAGFLTIGRDTESLGALLISGSLAHAIVHNELKVGRDGVGDLTVSNGGSIIAGSAIVGSGGAGTVTVGGLGSQLSVSNGLTIGGAVPTGSPGDDCDWSYEGGSGFLAVENHGHVLVGNVLTLADPSSDLITVLVQSGGNLQVGIPSPIPQPDELQISTTGLVIGHGIISVGNTVGEAFMPGTIANDGTIEARDGSLVLEGNVTGIGQALIDSHSTLEVDDSFTGTVVFNGDLGTLTLGTPDHFNGSITSLALGDSIGFLWDSLPADVEVSHTSIEGSLLTIALSNNETLKYQVEGDLLGNAFTITDAPTQIEFTLAAASPSVTTGIAGSGYGNAFIDSLIWGWGAWNPSNGPITYWFGTSADINAAISVHGETEFLTCNQTVDQWSLDAQTAFTRALTAYSAVSGLRFEKAASVEIANVVSWLVPELGEDGTLGLSEVPAQRPDGHLWQYFDDTAFESWSNQQLGGDGNFTIVHELGHAMGLAHPFDGGVEADRTIFPGSEDGSVGTNGENQGIYSVMSYNTGWDQASHDFTFGAQTGLGAFDIAALQVLYGANTSFHIDADTYVLPTINAAGTGWSCIWDGGGIDTISNAWWSVASTIDLRAAPLVGENAGGYVSYIHGVAGGFTIAHGVIIENAVGGSGDDTLIGNAVGNVLTGGGGNDVIDGGAGFDTAFFSGKASEYTVQTYLGLDGLLHTQVKDRVAARDGTDDLVNIEHLRFKNTDPIAANDVAGVTQGAKITGNVLANDSDPDGDALAVTGVNGGSLGHDLVGRYGTLALNANGNFTYTSNANAQLPAQTPAQDVFTYTESDGNGGTAEATLTITIVPKGQSYIAGTPGQTISAGNGKGIVDGSLGHQNVRGGNGADTLIGGPDDVLTGGNGPDLFVFRGAFGKNEITDFKNPDQIVLERAVFGSPGDVKALYAVNDGHGNTVITDPHTSSNMIIVDHITVSQLQNSMFLLV